MGKAPSTSYPGPSAQEKALQQKQLELLEKSEAREALWEPIVMSQMGYQTFKDPETGETKIEKLPEEEYLSGLSETDRQAYNIQKLSGERQLKAMRGELEIDPAVERDIANQLKRLKESYSSKLGRGWETSTPGIEAMANYRQRAAEMRNSVRRGEMTASEALSQSRASQLERERQELLRTSSQQTQSGLSLAGAYESPRGWLERAREGTFRGKQLKAQMQAEKMRGISGGMSGAGCCFNFMEAEGDIPTDVKSLRDALFQDDSSVARGYRRMAVEFVPLMRKFPDFKDVVRETMTQPITKYAEWVYGKNDYGYIYAPACYGWAQRWHEIGSEPNGKEMTWEEFWNSKNSYNQTTIAT